VCIKKGQNERLHSIEQELREQGVGVCFPTHVCVCVYGIGVCMYNVCVFLYACMYVYVYVYGMVWYRCVYVQGVCIVVRVLCMCEYVSVWVLEHRVQYCT
jgi:hypothetical protein